jgi:hypothetical protein
MKHLIHQLVYLLWAFVTCSIPLTINTVFVKTWSRLNCIRISFTKSNKIKSRALAKRRMDSSLHIPPYWPLDTFFVLSSHLCPCLLYDLSTSSFLTTILYVFLITSKSVLFSNPQMLLDIIIVVILLAEYKLWKLPITLYNPLVTFSSELQMFSLAPFSNAFNLEDSKRFWRWCMSLRITGFLDFAHSPWLQRTRRFGNWICFRQVSGVEDIYSVESVRADPNHLATVSEKLCS